VDLKQTVWTDFVIQCSMTSEVMTGKSITERADETHRKDLN